MAMHHMTGGMTSAQSLALLIQDEAFWLLISMAAA